MAVGDSSLNLPPSGSWSGYYLYGADGAKHRMRLHLIFTAVGAIVGSGNDDVAPFTIGGVFDGDTNQANWAKSYVGMHSVEYRGLYDGRSICGDWTLTIMTGGFWIWPDGFSEEAEFHADVEVPTQAV